jgi:hypothetical protein
MVETRRTFLEFTFAHIYHLRTKKYYACAHFYILYVYIKKRYDFESIQKIFLKYENKFSSRTITHLVFPKIFNKKYIIIIII